MDGIYTLAWSPDGKWLAAAGQSPQIQIWDVDQGQLVKILVAKNAPIRSIAWSSDNQYFASGQGDWKERLPNQIQVWQVRDGELAWEAKDALFGAYSVCFSPDSKWLVTGHGKGKTILWHTKTGQQVIRSTVNQDIRNLINGVNFSPDSQHVVCGTCYENALYMYGVDGTIKQEIFLTPQSSWVDFEHPLCFSPNGRFLARGSQDGSIHLWDGQDLTPLQKLIGHRAPTYALSWHPDSQILATGSRFGFIHFWDIATQKIIKSIKHRPFHALAYNANGRLLASSGDRQQIQIWNGDYTHIDFGENVRTLG